MKKVNLLESIYNWKIYFMLKIKVSSNCYFGQEQFAILYCQMNAQTDIF